MIFALIILHSVNGHEVIVNPKLITNMRAGTPGQKNQYVVDGVSCVINMTDGKFVTVVESCDKVRAMIKEQVK